MYTRNSNIKDPEVIINAKIVVNSTQDEEPAWVHAMPAATGLWSMILTFRERGSYDVADNLLAAAEKNWEAHLRTQALMSKRQSPRVLSTSAPSPRFTHKEIIEKPKEIEICNKETKSDNVAEKKLDEIKVDTEVRRSRSRQTSVRLEPPPCSAPVSPLKSCATSPRSLSPISSCSLSPTRDPFLSLPINEQHTNTFDCYACYHSRLKSYERSKFRWVSPSPSQLSEAGFFFIGPRDKVQCFSCETSHKNWKPAEDPWERHTCSSPSCDYIIETRGLDFISRMMEKVKNGIINTYTRSNSGKDITSKSTEAEFAKMKLKTTKSTTAGSGWQLDPYKERGVSGKVGKKKK